MSEELEAIKKIQETVHTIDKKMDIVVYQNEEQDKELDKHSKEIYGNGKLGMKVQVAIMWWVLGLAVGGISLIVVF